MAWFEFLPASHCPWIFKETRLPEACSLPYPWSIYGLGVSYTRPRAFFNLTHHPFPHVFGGVPVSPEPIPTIIYCRLCFHKICLFLHFCYILCYLCGDSDTYFRIFPYLKCQGARCALALTSDTSILFHNNSP